MASLVSRGRGSTSMKRKQSSRCSSYAAQPTQSHTSHSQRPKASMPMHGTAVPQVHDTFHQQRAGTTGSLAPSPSSNEMSFPASPFQPIQTPSKEASRRPATPFGTKVSLSVSIYFISWYFERRGASEHNPDSLHFYFYFYFYIPTTSAPCKQGMGCAFSRSVWRNEAPREQTQEVRSGRIVA